MTPSYPSIQSFYQRESTSRHNQAQQQSGPQSPPSSTAASPLSSSLPVSDNGFSSSELSSRTGHSHQVWHPQRNYELVKIGDLVPGPRALRFEGRIVNFRTLYGKTQKQPRALGWQYLLVKDDSGVISVCAPLLLLYSIYFDYIVVSMELFSVPFHSLLF